MSSTSTTEPRARTQSQPTRARYGVVGFAVALAVLSYIDRVAISQAAPIITKELGLTYTQMGNLFAAFAIAYALFEIPGGWMGDRIGARKVLMRIVLWWSFFTAATGYMWSYGSMYVTRFMFGAGEAGCFPNITKAFTAWLPNSERAKSQGILWMSARWGGAFTPLLVVATFHLVSWRVAFVLFGCLGIVWAVGFYKWFRDNPRDHKSVNEAELELLAGNEGLASGHANVPWRALLRSPTIWFLWIQYFLLSYGWYFYITWLPTFLNNQFPDLSDYQRAALASMPLLFGGIGSYFSGSILWRVGVWTGSVTKARRLMAYIGFFFASIMLLLSIQVQSPVPVMVLVGMASFFNDLVMPGAWATCMDIGGKYAGTVSGSMNMMGNMAGFVSPWIAGVLKDKGYDWNVYIYSMALAYFLGTFCWPFIHPEKPLEGAY